MRLRLTRMVVFELREMFYDRLPLLDLLEAAEARGEEWFEISDEVANLIITEFAETCNAKL